MRTLAYELQGKDVPAHLKGVVINIRQPENYKDAETLTKNGEPDVAAKFGDGYAIGLQGALRTRSGKKNEDGTFVNDQASLQAFSDGYVYSVQAEGTPRVVKPETKQARTEREAGNKLFEKAASDEKFRNMCIKNGVIEQAAFDEYLADKAALAATKTAPANAAA